MCTGTSEANYARLLQAIDDHQSKISDLSDDNACDDTFEPAQSQSDDTEESDGSDSDTTQARRVPVWKVMDFQPILQEFQGTVGDGEARSDWNAGDYVKQYIDEDKKYLDVERPDIIKQYRYNSLMGGVYLSDRMMSYYRMDARTCEWTIRTVFHFVDLAIVNAWIGYRQDAKAKGILQKDILQLMDFRMEIAQTYLAAVDEDSEESDTGDDEVDQAASSSRRHRVVPVPSLPARTSGAKHLPEMTQSSNGMRCRKTGCAGKTKIRCAGCKIFLCMTAERNCFMSYHTKP